VRSPIQRLIAGCVIGCQGTSLAQAGLDVSAPDPSPLRAAVARATEDCYFGAVLVVRDRTTVLEDYRGGATLDGGPPDANTLFDIASISKQFTAAAILRLWERGRLSLHDRLDRFFPAIPAALRDIRVENLLAHTSGLLQSTDFPAAISADRDRWLDALWLRARDGRAGERATYSNAGYGVLAAIVEVVANERFETFVAREVFRPARLTATRFVGEQRTDDDTARLARRGSRADRTALDWTYDWNHRGAVGVLSTPNDLMQWHLALSDDRRFSRALRERLLAPFERDYAGGLFTRRDARERRRQWHSGAIPGFQCWFARYPDDDSLILVLANEDYRLHTMVHGLEAALFELPPPASLEKAWGGTWSSDDAALRILKVEERWIVELIGARTLALDFDPTDRQRLLGAERALRALRRTPELRDAQRLALADLDMARNEWIVAAFTANGLRHHRVDARSADAARVSPPLLRGTAGHRLGLRWRTRHHFDAVCRGGLERLDLWLDGEGPRATLRLEQGAERIVFRRDG
jgi:CubicO group peptidase (beta-lactamase class C family)